MAHFVEMPNISAFSNTPEGALRGLSVAWKCVKETYEEDQEPIPQAPSREGYEGPVNAPVDAQLYHALVNEAAEARMSLYALAAQKLKSTESVVQEG